MFDIAIYNQNTLLYLIEYDGIQHFEENILKITMNKLIDLLKNQY